MASLTGQRSTAQCSSSSWFTDAEGIKTMEGLLSIQSAHEAPRCSIFQELAGEYSVDDVEEDVERARQENNRSRDSFAGASSSRQGQHDEIFDRQAGPSRSVLSLTYSLFFSQGVVAESPILDELEDPVGWESGLRESLNNLADLFVIQSRRLMDDVSQYLPEGTPRSSVTSSTSTSTNVSSSSSSSSLQKSIYSGKSPSKSAHLIKSITSAPSKACCALFRRNCTKLSPLGISNYDEPIR